MEKEGKDKVRTFFFVHDSGLPIISKEEIKFEQIKALLSVFATTHNGFIFFKAIDDKLVFINLNFIDRIINISITEFENVIDSQRMLKGKLIDLPSLKIPKPN